MAKYMLRTLKRILRIISSRAAVLRCYLRRQWINISHVGVYIEPNVEVSFGVFFKVTDNGKMIIGSGSSIGFGSQITVCRGVLHIGSNVHIGPCSVICAMDSISIGDDTLIAERVTIRDQNHNIKLPGLIRSNGMNVAPINIGPDVWIGANAVILKGVTIGGGAVIGASSVVTADVESNDIVVGIPAKSIGNRVRE